jgi:transposase
VRTGSAPAQEVDPKAPTPGVRRAANVLDRIHASYEGDSTPGHRRFNRRHDHENPGADLGNLVRFVLLPGQRFDTAGVPPLIDGVRCAALIADKAFDSNAIIADLDERGAKVVISQHPRRIPPLPIDLEMYKWRHLIENFFCKLKEFKRIAMRADKTDQSFAAHLAAAVINSR